MNEEQVVNTPVVEPSQSSVTVEPMKGKKKPAKAKDLKKSEAKPTKKAGKVSWAEKYRAGTIGRMIADEIVAGKLDNDGILEKVKKAHKGAKTTYACVTWYKTHARAAKAIK